MTEFQSYDRQTEPNKADKAEIWQTAIGLQDIDGLKPSDYLIENAKLHIEGELSIDEVKSRLDTYYQQPQKSPPMRTEEADKVSARITELLSEQTFNLSIVEYLSIHRRLFLDIYPFAGQMRDYNISKKEWVLNGESVFYASADSLRETLEYDLSQEKRFSYKGLTQSEIVQHLAFFTANLWQIHPFGEGNTRTTAVFLMKYLRKLGFSSFDHQMFAQHSWYFRNALVRANYENLQQGVFATPDYLVQFLENLLFSKKHLLQNRMLKINLTQGT